MEQNTPEIKHIKLTDIFVDEDFNCRGKIAPIDVVDLAKDIAGNGLIQPVSVIKNPHEGMIEPYMLIAGFRRYMAHRVNKMETIMCIINEKQMGEAQRRLFNLAENIQRKDLDIIQESKALKRLKDLGLSEYDVAEQLRKSRGWVQVRYMVLDLPEELYPDLIAGNIVQSQIRELHTILRVTGKKEFVFNAAKQMKSDKIKGVTKKDYAPKTYDTKKVRGKREMFEMIDLLYDELGQCEEHLPMAKALGWASGNVTDGDFYKYLKRLADENNLFFDIPEQFKEFEMKTKDRERDIFGEVL